MASFVLTPAELDYVQQPDEGTHYWVEAISVDFTTTREFVSAVLPPCFSPSAQPVGQAVVASYRREDGPGRMIEFDMTAVYIEARYGDVTGFYSLWMLLDEGMPITLGREISGEIKKQGRSRIYTDGQQIYAYGSRKGVRVVELNAEVGPDTGAGTVEYRSLELKAVPTPDRRFRDTIGVFHNQPSAVIMHTVDEYRTTRAGTATLTFSANGFDPVESIPVVSTGPARYVAGRSIFRCETQQVLDIDQAVLEPYVMGRAYDELRG